MNELTYLINYDFIDEEDVLICLRSRSDGMHIVITGRDASAGLLETAEVVAEMHEIKHPYKQGVLAQKGIEF